MLNEKFNEHWISLVNSIFKPQNMSLSFATVLSDDDENVLIKGKGEGN